MTPSSTSWVDRTPRELFDSKSSTSPVYRFNRFKIMESYFGDTSGDTWETCASYDAVYIAAISVLGSRE